MVDTKHEMINHWFNVLCRKNLTWIHKGLVRVWYHCECNKITAPIFCWKSKV